MIWARFSGSPVMHCIASVRDSAALAYCRHEWQSADTVEVDERPEHERRCEQCVRVLVDQRCVERGLDELREANRGA